MTGVDVAVLDAVLHTTMRLRWGAVFEVAVGMSVPLCVSLKGVWDTWNGSA